MTTHRQVKAGLRDLRDKCLVTISKLKIGIEKKRV